MKQRDAKFNPTMKRELYYFPFILQINQTFLGLFLKHPFTEQNVASRDMLTRPWTETVFFLFGSR